MVAQQGHRLAVAGGHVDLRDVRELGAPRDELDERVGIDRLKIVFERFADEEIPGLGRAIEIDLGAGKTLAMRRLCWRLALP